MRSSHIQLIDLLATDLRFAGVPQRAIQPLTSLKLYAESREPQWFNSTTNFDQATSDALKCASRVFKYLVAKTQRSQTLKLEPESIFESARLAAQAGQHKQAVDLLLLWVERKRMKAAGDETKIPPTPHPAARARAQSFPADASSACLDAESVLEDLKDVLRELLRIGCHSPWPATVAELASTQCGAEHDYVYKTACLSKEDFLSVVSENLDERENPFRRGARVLVKCDGKGQTPWRHATIQMRFAEDDAKRAEGYLWKVKVPGIGPLCLPEEAVLAASEGGLPAVLRAAAQTGNLDVTKWLLEARGTGAGASTKRISLYETDREANTAVVLSAAVKASDSRADSKAAAKACKVLLHSEQGRAIYKPDIKQFETSMTNGPLADVSYRI